MSGQGKEEGGPAGKLTSCHLKDQEGKQEEDKYRASPGKSKEEVEKEEDAEEEERK